MIFSIFWSTAALRILNVSATCVSDKKHVFLNLLSKSILKWDRSSTSKTLTVR